MPKQMIRKTLPIIERKTIDEEKGIYQAWISTESIDRDQDILEAAGVKIDNYLKNPIVLFGHNYWSVEAVVGKTLSLDIRPGEGVVAKWRFAKRGANPKADIVRNLWDDELLNATSVGFDPLEWERRKNDLGEDLNRGIRYKIWELLEFSIVPVPANQDALRLALKRLELEHDQPEGRLVQAVTCAGCYKQFDISAHLATEIEKSPYKLICKDCAPKVKVIQEPQILGPVGLDTLEFDEVTRRESAPDTESPGDPDQDLSIDLDAEITNPEDLQAIDALNYEIYRITED